jgi:hypothetical protein
MRYEYNLLDIYRFLFRVAGRIRLCLFFLFYFSNLLISQDIILEGKVYDKVTNQILSTVSVHDKSSLSGGLTDERGAFKMSLSKGSHVVEISHLGYQTIDTVLYLTDNLSLSIYMFPADVSLREVKITANGSDNIVSSAHMGSFTISKKEIMKIPTLLGETDPLGILRLTPGVQSGSEGNVGFYVRGGGSDQNLILYDNVQIYNPGHILGFFSVFNPEIVRDITIIKSGIPAQYGGKLSSAIVVESYKGNRDSVELMGSIGLVSTRLALSGPFLNKKGTFILGARRTYLGLFVEPAIRRLAKNKSFFNKNNIYNFYDLNAGASLKISGRDILTFSTYIGRDSYKMVQEGIKQNNSLKWGNSLGSIQWNHKFNDLNSWNTTISLTKYIFDLSGSQSDYYFGLFSSAEDYSLKSDFILINNRHRITTGFELTEHRFIPNRIDAQANNFTLNFGQFNTMHSLEGGIFVDDEFPVTSHFSVSGGFRFSFFNHHGPYSEFFKNSLDQITDTLFYPRNKSLAFYSNPEPRISIKYQINNSNSLKASYTRIAQYVHLATSATVSLPTDIWIPSTAKIKPMTGDQISIGYFSYFHNKDFEFSSELYYKRMNNKLDFLRGVVFNSIFGNIEDNIVTGFGQSYGIEFYLRKKRGNFTGWISYSLSRTEQKFDEINSGMFYPAKYDRRHDIALNLTRKFNKNWSSSAVFVYTSGNAFTMPVGRYIIQGNIVNQYGDVNKFRMPPYNRLDLSLTRKIMIKERWSSELNFSVYNVYNRANPYFIYFEAVGDLETYSLEIKARVVSLFPIIPSVSWSFVF